jgi:hypothetical protein
MVESHENEAIGRHRSTSPEPVDGRLARLHLSVPPFRTSSGWAYPYLMVRNEGPATAFDVRLSFQSADPPLDPSADAAGPTASPKPLEIVLPTFVDGEPTLATLGSGEVISFGISPPWGEPARWLVEMRWADDVGPHVDRRLVSKQVPD